MELKNLYEHTYMQTISNCQTFVDNNLIIKDNNIKKVWRSDGGKISSARSLKLLGIFYVILQFGIGSR